MFFLLLFYMLSFPPDFPEKKESVMYKGEQTRQCSARWQHRTNNERQRSNKTKLKHKISRNAECVLGEKM
jgi:hypothetical protein